MLKRSITPLHATALVVGIIIGASIFVQPTVIAGTLPGVGAVYLVWIVSGILTLFGALIAAELASAYPEAGGVYVFLREAFSPAVGFLWGWAMFWTMHTGIIAVIAMVFARYASFFVPVGDVGQGAMAVGAIALLTGINCLGVRQGSLLQTTFTILKVGAVVAIIVLAFTVPHAEPLSAHRSSLIEIRSTDLVAGIVAGLFAFGGWHMVTYAAEETTEPEKTIPRALVIGVAIVTLCYIAMNAAYFHVLTPQQVASSTRVAADAADAILGHGGAAVMSAIVAVSTFGALNGVILAGPRAYLAMARDGLVSPWLAAIHDRFRTPHRAILLQGAWAIVLVSTGTYRALFTRVVYTEWIFFAAMAIGLMRLRARASYRPAYRVWGYPAVPIVFIISSIYIVYKQVVTDGVSAWIGLGLVAAGWPVYALFLKKPSMTTAQHAD